jgi:hypothetical protein
MKARLRNRKPDIGKTRIPAFCVLVSVFCLLASAAWAACTSPAGNAGDHMYNSAYHVPQYCDGANWHAMGHRGVGGAGCSSPAGSEGDIMYNGASHVLQFCDGAQWLAMGPTSACPECDFTGPVGWWKLDETSGPTAADFSGNANTGTLVNGPVWTTGYYNGALLFANPSGVDMGSPPTLQIGGSITLTAWINGSSWNPNDEDEMILSKNQNNYGVWGIKGSQDCTGVNGQDNFIAYVCTLGGSGLCPELCSNTILLTNTWYFVAGVYDSSVPSLHVYVNGVLDDGTLINGPVGTGLSDTAYNIMIGRTSGQFAPGLNQAFNGKIDDPRVYNRALSAAEVMALYNGAGTGCTSPAGNEGDMMYNNPYRVMQYCDGMHWRQTGR